MLKRYFRLIYINRDGSGFSCVLGWLPWHVYTNSDHRVHLFVLVSVDCRATALAVYERTWRAKAET